ncbi:MAG: CPBP family intramembrane metalloprotease [Clostridia bacterium]|nr:CPBP family intramembrane metalloprotease [Clostridia bacterium]
MNNPIPEKKPQKRSLLQDGIRIGVSAVAVVMIFILTTVAQIVMDKLVRRVAPEIASQAWYVMALSGIPMYGFAMPLSYLIFRLVPAEAPEKKRMKFYVWLGLLAICFGLTYAGNMVGTLVNQIIGLIRGEPVVNELASMTTSTPWWANLLVVGILAPIMEEIFYRKMVIDRLSRYGDLPAILISGIAFGLIHGNFSQFFYAALLGCLFGYIYLKTGKIRYTIFLHMAINLVGGVFTSELTKLQMSGEYEILTTLLLLAYFAFVMLMIVGAIVAAVLLIIFCRKPLRRAENPLAAREWCRVLLLNPAVWLFAALIVFLFVA